MKTPPIRIVLLQQLCLVVCFFCLSFTTLAQRPDSVQINGEWYFVYPIDEEVIPTRSMLNRTGFSEKQFALFLQWKLAGDPRTGLRFKSLKDSLNAELVRTKRILSREQDFSNWMAGTEPPDYWSRTKKRKSLMRRFPAVNAWENDPGSYDLVPTVGTLPDGKYIQYFAPFLTFDNVRKMEVISGKTAAVFSLKDNLLHGEYTRLNYNGDTVKHGMFEEGLKEGHWILLLEGDYEKGTVKSELITTGTRMWVELNGGKPEGSFHIMEGTYYETFGQYKNGFACGRWKMKSGNSTIIYHQIIAAEEWVNDTTDVLFVISGERAKKEKGFDFREWKNHSTSPMINNEFVLRNTIQIKSRAIDDFGKLIDNPIKAGSVSYEEEYYYGRKTNRLIRFSGSQETLIDDWMIQRVTFDRQTHALNYSKFYQNGQLFDTMEYRSSDSLFHYRMYDINGKLYLENTYDIEGDLVERKCYAIKNQKQTKQEKVQERTYIEGYSVLEEGSYYSENRKWGYVWYNTRDSIIADKKYTYIAWDLDTKKRLQEEYFLRDTLHKVYYNKGGEKAFELEVVQETKTYSEAEELVNKDIRYTSFWDDWSWRAERDTSGFYRSKLYKSGELYSGELKVQFSKKKVLKHYSEEENLLVLTLPRYYYSTTMTERFLDLELFPLEKQFFYRKKNWNHRSRPSVLMQLMSSLLSNHQLIAINQKEIRGNVTDGVLSGNWTSYSRKGEPTTQLTFQNGLASGTVKQYSNYKKPSLYARRWKKYNAFYYQQYSRKKPDNYLGTEYSLKNGQYDGSYIKRGVNGDVLLQVAFKNGQPDGFLMGTKEGDTLTGSYRNGLAHGSFYFREDDSDQSDTTLFVQFWEGKIEGNYLFFNQESDIKLRRRSVFGREEGDETEIHSLRAKFSNNQLDGRMIFYDSERQPKYGMALKLLTEDSIFFFENGSVSYFYCLDSVAIKMNYDVGIVNGIYSTAAHLINDPLKADNVYLTSWLYDLPERMESLNTGYFTKLYPNNQVARTGYRSNEKKSGLWKFYSYEGNLLYTIDYSDTMNREEAIGLYTEYSSEGKILSKRYLIEELEKYDCSHSDYYAIRQFVVFEDTKDSIDRSNGLQKNYYDNGMQMSEGNLKNGVPDGVWKFFTPDGRLTIVGKYINGKKEGRWLYGDLGDKKYIGEICLDPDDPFLDFHIAELANKKDIKVQIYKNGVAKISQFHEVND